MVKLQKCPLDRVFFWESFGLRTPHVEVLTKWIANSDEWLFCFDWVRLGASQTMLGSYPIAYLVSSRILTQAISPEKQFVCSIIGMQWVDAMMKSFDARVWWKNWMQIGLQSTQLSSTMSTLSDHSSHFSQFSRSFGWIQSLNFKVILSRSSIWTTIELSRGFIERCWEVPSSWSPLRSIRSMRPKNDQLSLQIVVEICVSFKFRKRWQRVRVLNPNSPTRQSRKQNFGLTNRLASRPFNRLSNRLSNRLVNHFNTSKRVPILGVYL